MRFLNVLSRWFWPTAEFKPYPIDPVERECLQKLEDVREGISAIDSLQNLVLGICERAAASGNLRLLSTLSHRWDRRARRWNSDKCSVVYLIFSDKYTEMTSSISVEERARTLCRGRWNPPDMAAHTGAYDE